MQTPPLPFFADPLPNFHSCKSLQELEQCPSGSIRLDGAHYQNSPGSPAALPLPQCPPASLSFSPLPMAIEPGCPWGFSHTDLFAQALEQQDMSAPTNFQLPASELQAKQNEHLTQPQPPLSPAAGYTRTAAAPPVMEQGGSPTGHQLAIPPKLLEWGAKLQQALPEPLLTCPSTHTLDPTAPEGFSLSQQTTATRAPWPGQEGWWQAGSHHAATLPSMQPSPGRYLFHQLAWWLSFSL